MSATSIQVPYPVFYDRDGQPLDNGNIYIGVANLDPVTNPLQAYYDEALTIPASQPLKTSGGYVYRNGTPAQVYVDAVNFSILVNDEKNLLVYSFPDGTGISPNASGITYNEGSVGAVNRTVESRLQDYVSVKDFGVVGDGVTDDTAAIQAALNAARHVYIPVPPVEYAVSSLNIPANTTVETENASVKFQQIAGQPVGTRVFNVMGPNVTIGDMTVEGNIATDTNEQNHAINISTATAGTDLYNIRIGNIYGVNLRGDVVYIGQTLANGTVKNVSVASADGNNILRNVVSVVGGENIEIGQVTGSAVGYMHVDIEPDGTYTGNAINVSVGQVKGRHIGIVVNTPSGDLVFCDNIRFGEVWLDPSFASQSTPSYSPGASIASRAVILRSYKNVYIGSLNVSNYDGSVFWKESGGVTNGAIYVDQADFSDCNKVDGGTYAYVMAANITFGYLKASTPLVSAINKRVLGNDNIVVQSGNFSLGSNASVARNGTRCVVRNSTIVGQTGATGNYVALSVTSAKFENCSVSGDIERFAGFSTGVEIENSTVAVTVAMLNTVTKAVYKNSTIQGQYYAFATGDRTYTEAIAFGTQFLWVDSAGKLRIKSGAPTSDTDGTIVGTQT